MLNIPLNNPRDQIACHIPFLVNPSDNETYLVFHVGHPVIIAAVCNRIDTDLEADEDSALMDVGYDSGIFAMDLAFAQVVFADIAVNAFYIRLHRDVGKGIYLDA